MQLFYGDHCDCISDLEDITGGGRSIWGYYGLTKPVKDDVEKFIKITSAHGVYFS